MGRTERCRGWWFFSRGVSLWPGMLSREVIIPGSSLKYRGGILSYSAGRLFAPFDEIVLLVGNFVFWLDNLLTEA